VLVRSILLKSDSGIKILDRWRVVILRSASLLFAHGAGASDCLSLLCAQHQLLDIGHHG